MTVIVHETVKILRGEDHVSGKVVNVTRHMHGSVIGDSSKGPKPVT